ncbi:hypothetical protein EK599_03295 [Vibrio sp. T187]|uniref:hypothetical protein n=1 Tax=Vibrio TaxID=662 RepID=UPI0010C98175|nr:MULTISPECIES: hypothetical protein [Vibrio]MBW3694703.1 hypothetical protein [Vibrio sp. T187]
MKRLNRTLGVVSLVLAGVLSGCAEKVQERQGQAINVVPIEHQVSFKAQSVSKTEAEIRQFVDNNVAVLLEKGTTLTWHGGKGKELARFTRTYMQGKGINHSLIAIQEAKSDIQHAFDLSLAYTEFQVVSQVCSYESIDHFGHGETGCYAENARWQSMVNPEKMLNRSR